MTRRRRTRTAMAALGLAAALAPLAASSPARAEQVPQIAVVAGRGFVVVGEDGTGRREFPRSSVAVSPQAWSARKRILYLANRSATDQQRPQSQLLPSWQLRVTNAAGTRDRSVTAFDLCCRSLLPLGIEAAGQWLDAPVSSPDGSKIAFVVWSCVNSFVWGVGCLPSSEIFVVRSDGSSLTPRAEGLYGYGPTWSPDSHRLAFTRAYSGGIEVVEADPTGVPRRISPVDVLGHAPVWSPDGRKIVFVGQRGVISVPGQLWVASSDGSTARELPAFTDDRPSWSPDGRWIAYSVGPSRWRTAIAVIRSNGTGARRITRKTADQSFQTSPQWSASGRIVYLHSRRSGTSVMTITPTKRPRPREVAFVYDQYPTFALSG